MAETVVETLKLVPCLDLELLLVNSESACLKGKLVEKLLEKWAAWLPCLQARRLLLEDKAYLALWLDAAVEDEVDKVFASSPSEGFLLNSLAQTLCMTAVHDLLPRVAQTGCAPVPELTPALRAVLEGESLCKPCSPLELEKRQWKPARRYAVLTWFSFGAGCPDCSLGEDCGKGMNIKSMNISAGARA
jgi:hypothetical protein